MKQDHIFALPNVTLALSKAYSHGVQSHVLNPTKCYNLLEKSFVANIIFVRPVYSWWGDLMVSITDSIALFLFQKKYWPKHSIKFLWCVSEYIRELLSFMMAGPSLSFRPLKLICCCGKKYEQRTYYSQLEMKSNRTAVPQTDIHPPQWLSECWHLHWSTQTHT